MRKNDTSFIKTLFLTESRLAIIPLFQVIKKRIVIWVTHWQNHERAARYLDFFLEISSIFEKNF